MARTTTYDKTEVLQLIHDRFWEGVKQAKIVAELLEVYGIKAGMAYTLIRQYMQNDAYKENKVKLHNQIKNQLFATANSAFSMGYSRVFLETVDRIIAMFPSLKEEVEIVNDIHLEIKVVDKKKEE